jgi:hypothetical protein
MMSGVGVSAAMILPIIDAGGTPVETAFVLRSTFLSQVMKASCAATQVRDTSGDYLWSASTGYG